MNTDERAVAHTYREHVAQQLGFGYQAQKQASLLSIIAGPLLNFDYLNKPVGIMTGQYQKYPLQICFYLNNSDTKGRVTLKRPREDVTTTFTVQSQVANFRLQPPNIGDAELSKSHDPKKHLVHLEGDFDEHFMLYTSDENEVGARQVFQPDLMVQLIQVAGSVVNPVWHTIAFADNKLSISGTVTKDEAALMEFLTFAERVCSTLAPSIEAAGRVV